MRIVALGASNLTRGLPALVATARARWGHEVEVLAAIGTGTPCSPMDGIR